MARASNGQTAIIRTERGLTIFLIITIGDPDRVNESDYRERCVERLVEIVIDIQDYMRGLVGCLFHKVIGASYLLVTRHNSQEENYYSIKTGFGIIGKS